MTYVRVMESLDRLDRMLVHALKVDGRATFSAIGAALGVSDQTVARRYQRLRSAGVLRVVGMPGSQIPGQDEWFVRIRCTPDAAMPIADALARRDDTYWVQLASGGAEILCVTRPQNTERHDTLLLQKLPRTPRVTDVQAHQLLRSYDPDPLLFGVRLGAGAGEPASGGLDADAVDRLRPAPRDLPPTPLDDTDRAVIGVLNRDGRTGLAELARAAGTSESTVRRRLDVLRRSGSLRFDIDIEGPLTGTRAHVLLWLAVLPSTLTSTAESLVTHPEVNFAAIITGPSHILASVSCADGAALHEYLAGRIGSLTGVRRFETAPVQRMLKRHGLLDPA
ncbi:MAG TPA: Lrp/AsnC family transcriptional regulator [Actinocatenispora sp.]